MGYADDRERGGAGRSDNELLDLVRSRPREDATRQAACEELVGRHRGIVRSCARRYGVGPELAEDLMQVGYVGLMKAINNFDPAVGSSLAAYAQPCVSGEIKRFFRDKRWQLRIQRPEQELRLRIRAAGAELAQQLARPPSDADLAGALGVAEARIADAQLASQAFRVASLDAPVGHEDDGASLGDWLGAEDPALEHALDMASVWTHWPELPARQQRLLMMRFYGNMTQAEIAQQLGISQMHVSRLLSRALAHLRDKVTGTGESACPQQAEQ